MIENTQTNLLTHDWIQTLEVPLLKDNQHKEEMNKDNKISESMLIAARRSNEAQRRTAKQMYEDLIKRSPYKLNSEFCFNSGL